MRTFMILTSLVTLLATTVIANDCPGQTQMCCQQITSTGVGYYCAGPNAVFPCISAPALTAMCCAKYSLVPKGVSSILWMLGHEGVC